MKHRANNFSTSNTAVCIYKNSNNFNISNPTVYTAYIFRYRHIKYIYMCICVILYI